MTKERMWLRDHHCSGPRVSAYAKAIHALEAEEGSAACTTAVARRLGVTPSSVSAMLRRLAAQGLVELEPYRGVRLTGDGRQVARATVRRHRLLERFLDEVLSVPKDRLGEEAEVLERALSEDLEQRIAAMLGDSVPRSGGR